MFTFFEVNCLQVFESLKQFMFDCTDDVSGSWYPSGFHGHFRSKTRNDFEVPYRQHAKPIPPEKFINRAQVRSTNHLFSRHDNRNSHASGMGDLEMHFSMGLGKRKPTAVSSQHHRSTTSLLHWNNDINSTNHKEMYQSSYRNTYRQSNNNKRTVSNKGETTFIRHEPIHIRKNPELQRRLLSARPEIRNHSQPLLAWGPNSSSENSKQHFKPCVGDSSRRIIPKTHYDPSRRSCLETDEGIQPIRIGTR